MADQFFDIEPGDPASPHATQVELELKMARDRVAQLETKKAYDDALAATFTPALKAYAVVLHNAVCPHVHPNDCSWGAQEFPNDPARADWTETQHRRWLMLVTKGAQLQKQMGWSVKEPT